MSLPVEDDPRDVGAMIARMNRNVPVQRRSLMDYLENGGDTFVTRDGTECSFNRAALEALGERCSDQEKLTLRLPLFIATDSSSENGNWKIEGTTEVAVIARLLGRIPHRPDYLALYYPDLVELKKQLPGLIFTLFQP